MSVFHETMMANSLIELVGDTVYWVDWIPANAVKAPGVKPATAADVGIGVAWEFADGQEEQIRASFRLPTIMNSAKGIYFAFGWSSPAQSKICDWELSYSTMTFDTDMTAAAEDTIQFYSLSSATANGMAFQAIQLDDTLFAASDFCLHINLMRDGNDANDTLGDVAHLHGICLKYPLDGIGTLT